jgi:hypothetical protein
MTSKQGRMQEPVAASPPKRRRNAAAAAALSGPDAALALNELGINLDAGTPDLVRAEAPAFPPPEGFAAWPCTVRTPPRVPRAAPPPVRVYDGSDPLEAPRISPTGLFPREPYEAEIWIHLAACYELLRAAEYPNECAGIGASISYCIREGPAYNPPEPERHERMVQAGRAWVSRWIESTVAQQLDAARAFAADERAQLWAHGWLKTRVGSTIQYRNWGAMTLCLLMGAEPGLLRWVHDLQLAFKRASQWTRTFFELEGFTFCPRLGTHEKLSGTMRTAGPHAPAPKRYDPYDVSILPAMYRIQERLVCASEAFQYGCLRPGYECPTTHLEFSANLAPHAQLAQQGDVQMVYSQDSHTVDNEERLRRLLEFARHPPDLAEVERRCFGFEPKADGIRRVWCEVSEKAVMVAMRPDNRETPGHALGTELTPSLGVAVRRVGRHRECNPTTSPLWVGPPIRCDLPSGAVLAWPANLVHGWNNVNALSGAHHMGKMLCFASSFQLTSAHPQQAVWMYCWGVKKWADLDDAALAERLAVKTRTRTNPKRTSKTFTRKRSGRRGAAEEPPEEPPREPLFRRTPRPPRITSELEAEPMLRMASDLTHHSARLTEYTNNQAFAFMLTFVPQARRFFSVPYQLARALTLRFPQHYPPETTDIARLAQRLYDEKHRFQGPPEVARMIRTLWETFMPRV